MLRKLFGARQAASHSLEHAVPAGERVYAIGDIHGRLDLLDALLEQVDADDAARGSAATTLVFLGDLVDRGPASAAVVERLSRVVGERPATRFIMGNHEEIFLAALDGDDKALRLFCRIGGSETVLSYGMGVDEYEQLDYDALARRMDALVPQHHRDFLAGFEDMVTIGDYVFVHAGVRPGTPLAEQNTADLRWIRSSFLEHGGRLEKMVVHGHTITEEVEYRSNRIGIDTGAYESDRLTALGLEGHSRWILQT